MEQVSVLPVREQLIDRRQRLEHEIGRRGPLPDLAHLLQEVDAALARVSAGTYGLCETCRAPIEPDRLIADPLVRFCLEDLPPSEQRALERDLLLAADIQRALLPPSDATFDGWRLNYVYRPYRVVSGDYCDHVATASGIAASMLMAHLHAMFRALVLARPSLDVLMERASRAFCESTLPTHYATLVCGRATTAGDVELCTAGHPSPLVVRASGIETVESTGLPLGMFSSEQFGTTRLHLDPGDALLIFTDGVVEAEDASGTPYGVERIARVAAGAHGLEPAALVDTCARDLAGFVNGRPYADDVTMMALRRTAG